MPEYSPGRLCRYCGFAYQHPYHTPGVEEHVFEPLPSYGEAQRERRAQELRELMEKALRIARASTAPMSPSNYWEAPTGDGAPPSA